MDTTLPRVPKLDGAPVEGAEDIVASARERVEDAAPGSPREKKPSGAYFRKLRRARARGEPEPPRPRGLMGAAIPEEWEVDRSAFMRDRAPVSEPAPEREPEPEPPARLSAEDVQAAGAERKREAEDRAAADVRAQVLTIGRPQLEQRIGRAAQFIFTGAGYVLGDTSDEVWPLSQSQQDHLGVLLVEAFPDECAELMAQGTMVKLIAVGTVARIAADKWRRHKARKDGRPVAESSAPEREEESPAPRRRFAGLPDMQAA